MPNEWWRNKATKVNAQPNVKKVVRSPSFDDVDESIASTSSNASASASDSLSRLIPQSFSQSASRATSTTDDSGLMFGSKAIGNLLDSTNKNNNKIVEYFNNIIIPKSIKILDDAAFCLDNLDDPDSSEGIKNIFKNLFMVEPDDFSEDLQIKYEDIRQILVERDNNFISIKNEVFMNLHSSAGAVAAADKCGGVNRIHINKDFMNRVKFEKNDNPTPSNKLKPINIDEYGDTYFSAIMIHEASHLALDTEDHRYIKSAQYIEPEGFGMPVNMEELYYLARSENGISKAKENADSITYSAILLSMQSNGVLSYYPSPNSDIDKEGNSPKRSRMETIPKNLESIFAFRLRNF